MLELLEREHANDEDTLIFNELGILNGSSRVDIAVVNGEIAGFELKSERDTLGRLPAQRDLYNLVLDRVSLVVAEKHRNKAIDLVPDWWGIWIAYPVMSGRVEIASERLAQPNRWLDTETVCSFLWRDEALAILERYGAAQGVRSRPRRTLYQRLTEILPLDAIRSEVRNALKTRAGWRVDGGFQPHGG